ELAAGRRGGGDGALRRGSGSRGVPPDSAGPIQAVESRWPAAEVVYARAMSPPAGAVPRPSSTVIVLRDEPAGDGPFSVLLLERPGPIAVPGGAGFPRGGVDPAARAGRWRAP